MCLDSMSCTWHEKAVRLNQLRDQSVLRFKFIIFGACHVLDNKKAVYLIQLGYYFELKFKCMCLDSMSCTWHEKAMHLIHLAISLS